MRKTFTGTLLWLFLLHGAASAHFGMIIPDRSIATGEEREINISISFSHPFEQAGMDMARPAFYLYHNGNKTDLTDSLRPAKIMDAKGWAASYRPARPGVYQFATEPVPYWEPAEDCFIAHYAKTVVAAFGLEDGWDRELGLEMEIIPFSRPFGFYKGYTFTGQVKRHGKAVPFADIEVEYYNRNDKFQAPDEIFTTYTLKADQNGMFSFSCPLPGWWGFAALATSDKKMKGPDGKEKAIETGAVFWLQVTDWQKKQIVH
jgi:cobalt/nickel transport protein